jgi:uncharacterized protein (UPF0210 family)
LTVFVHPSLASSAQRIASLYLDMATLAYKWDKPLAVRVLPQAGKRAGDRTDMQHPFMCDTNIFEFD